MHITKNGKKLDHCLPEFVLAVSCMNRLKSSSIAPPMIVIPVLIKTQGEAVRREALFQDEEGRQ
jgi:hypothetical protein